jgi:Sec-independent protein translocase protein TatA
MFGIGGGEILIIAVIAVVLFGTDDLPKNLRKFMKMWNDFRGATHDLQRGWLDVRDKVTRDILNEESGSHQPVPESHVSVSDGGEASSGEVHPSEAEGLTENTITEDTEHSTLPVPRRAEGTFPLDEELPSTPDVSETSRDTLPDQINSGSDKST